MVAITSTERELQDKIRSVAGDDARVELLEKARRFKRSWIELAEGLVRVRASEAWRAWGFTAFDDYAARELHLKRPTVDKLCASFGFLQAHAPRLVREPAAGGDDVVHPVPSFQAVDYLVRAEERGAAPAETLEEMRRAALEEDVPARALARRYREVAFPVDPDEESARARTAAIGAARRLADAVATPALGLTVDVIDRARAIAEEILAALSS